MIAAVAAGIAVKIAHTWIAVQVLAVLVVVRISLILRWADFPSWYNSTLVALIGPPILPRAWNSRSFINETPHANVVVASVLSFKKLRLN
jgi:hypothetical protein